MSKAVLAQKGSFRLALKPGTCFWCRCGRFNSRPFFDGSHKVTDFTPVKAEVESRKKVAFCDGSRNNL